MKLNKKLKKHCYKFQIEGIKYINKKNGTCLLADEMGLGKTLQALGYIDLHPEFQNILIVCPATLKFNWKNEIKKWINQSCDILPKNTNKKIKIINYDILQKNIKKILSKKLDLLIGDEIHYIKNQSKRTFYFKKIARNSNRILAISGTPIENRPAEFWNVLNLICPQIFSNWFYFIKTFCDLKNNNGNLNYAGCKNQEKLNSLLINNCMIRRLKKDVLKELPKKIKTIIPLELDNQKEYKTNNNKLSKLILKNKKQIKITFNSFHQIQKLKKIAAEGKIKSIITWIENFLENEDKLVIMAIHHSIIDTLFFHFKKQAVKLDGRDSLSQREKSIHEFQTNKKIKLFIGNIYAAGVGINLTVSFSIGIIEFCWNPSKLDQAIDRIHRIGQTHACNIYFFIGINSIDEFIIDLIDSKRKNIDLILDGKSSNEKNLIRKLLIKHLEKNHD